MCEPRYWKSLFSYTKNQTLVIGATRSDGEVFKVFTNNIFFPSLVKIMKLLESYRTCICTSENICKKHKEQK